MLTTTSVAELLRQRRSIFPGMYIEREIPKAIIEEILENGTWAPTHQMTQPWRFRVLQGKKLEEMSQFLGDHYQANTPVEKYSAVKHKKRMANPLKSAAVIAICMKRDPEERLPEWEEIAATAMAVQNMWLTCTAHGIGCYWSTPGAMLENPDFLELEEGERCLGAFYMGYYQPHEVVRQRESVEAVTKWL